MIPNMLDMKGASRKSSTLMVVKRYLLYLLMTKVIVQWRKVLILTSKPQCQKKNQYHLSASLECEDLFDDINRKREERQRNIVHPLCYQENYSQSMNGNIRSKPEIPHVSVKPNTTTHLNYPVDNFGGHIVNMDSEMDLKKSKSLPLKKWVQKRKKSEDEFFPSFNIGDSTLDFASRETVIERSHIPPPCDPNIPINANENSACSTNIPEVIPHVPNPDTIHNELSVPNFTNGISTSEKASNNCVYASVSNLQEAEPQVANLSNVGSCPIVADEPPTKTPTTNAQPLTISSDDIDISLVTSCDLAVDEEQHKNHSPIIPNYLLLEGKSGSTVEQSNEKQVEDKSEKDHDDDNGAVVNSNSLPTEILEDVTIDNESTEKQEKPVSSSSSSSPSSSNALKTIAYMYDDENNVSENSLDASQIDSITKLTILNSKQKGGALAKTASVRLNRVLALWRYRNRLFPKSMDKKRTPLIVNKSKYKMISKTRCWREFSKFCCIKKKKTNGHPRAIIKKTVDHVVKKQESEVVNVVLSSLVDGVCQIGEISSQVEDHDEVCAVKSPELCLSIDGDHCNSSNKFEGKSSVVCWELASSDEKVTSTVGSDTAEEEGTNLVISEEYIGYAEGTMVDGSDDRVLHGILNWPHHEEEITSINEKESIKVSLPWVKIFKPHSNLPDGEKTLEIGPARIELRYSPAPIEYQPGHFKTSRNSVEKKSSIFSVKKVLLKHNTGPPTERLPKMVIKKTGCEEYKSYIKDAKLRVISIKNSNKDGQAEVIIEADGPLIGTVSDEENHVPENGSSSQGTSPTHKDSEVLADPEITDPTSETANELHHCLLCQESFTSLDKLHNHENSLSHRHIDIIQRNVLHKLQKTFKGAELPEFQPLSATEIEYLNWRPNFSGYSHFYHNVPL
uniref:C2H2-type domain-containing protein n=1 Tax=Lygus hesperus TaxID=30085 RepID=A0A146KL30_LYGHE